ncbi:hypothetical protein [Sphingomonas sp. NFR15]|uniref:hypothetical protein n=1 Tax=Sphingomonas sp. NFR15 TaxID=1566282 RepID=UPI0008867FB9|nr:hypothetical protein [Sphingomonas sp. NFR15]SDA14724.1 hypothetical protein SAMN03159340_00585 [Sphingomonas sp. NFR15]
MRILIHSELIAEDAHWRNLEVLLDRARELKCYVDAIDPVAVKSSEWFNQLSQSRKVDWLNATDWAVRDAAVFRLRSIVATTGRNFDNIDQIQLPLDEVLRLLDRPKRLWVENDRNDRYFWLAMMASDLREMFLDFERRGVVEFSSRGGLDELRASLEAQVARGASGPLDSWVLFDSDGEVPGHRSASANAMASFCQAAGISHHCLSRRAIENYLPLKALWSWADGAKSDRRPMRRAAVDAYKRMNVEQRYHYHLKSGWPKPESQQVKDFYASVSQRDKISLRNGISNNIAQQFEKYLEQIRGWIDAEGMDVGVQNTLEAITDWVRVPYA